MSEQETCLNQKHDLFHAKYSLMSRDATRVYVICFCGQGRELRAEDWEKIEAERSRLGRSHRAVERKEAS